MTHYDPRRHHRRTIRLRTWDYGAAGAYFVTLVAQNRQLLFETVADGRVASSPLGEIVEREWLRSAAIRQEIVLDLFIVMPNHVHGIVWVEPGTLGVVGATGRSPLRGSPARGPTPKSLGAFVGGFKSAATTRINQLRGTPRAAVWQRNYYERVIRDEEELARLRQYIEDNPAQWSQDRENPQLGNRAPS